MLLMDTKNGTDKYAAQRALNELDAKRAAEGWTGDTGLYPKLTPPPAEEPAPQLPALVRRQAD